MISSDMRQYFTRSDANIHYTGIQKQNRDSGGYDMFVKPSPETTADLNKQTNKQR